MVRKFENEEDDDDLEDEEEDEDEEEEEVALPPKKKDERLEIPQKKVVKEKSTKTDSIPVQEVEVNLSLINQKLNFIINLLTASK